MYCVFDGGLSIQEYETATINEQLSIFNLQTEFVRGEGMGGGVGGMVYSIKNGHTQGEHIICSHANHRGDVIARSNQDRSLTSFALYEAYGTRPYEWGDDPDRQKANTKEEESDLGLLNEGFRFRDLETGTFITRDPIGFKDGPNMYCYVHCNPVTKFDPLGLKTREDYEKDQEKATEEKDEAMEELEERWEDRDKDNDNYRASRDRIYKKYYKSYNRAQDKINKITQTASSMAQLLGDDTIMGAYHISTLLDDEDASYKKYRRSDAYMRWTGTKKFAGHATNGEYGKATTEYAKQVALTYLGGKLLQGTGAALRGSGGVMQIGVRQGGGLGVHAGWKVGGTAMHANGTKPLFFLTGAGRRYANRAGLSFGEQMGLQSISTQGAVDFFAMQGTKTFTVPALNPSLALKGGGNKALSCVTSTWNAWSAANYNIPNAAITYAVLEQASDED